MTRSAAPDTRYWIDSSVATIFTYYIYIHIIEFHFIVATLIDRFKMIMTMPMSILRRRAKGLVLRIIEGGEVVETDSGRVLVGIPGSLITANKE